MMENKLTALITEIERFSVHDGPGIRTTVFLKGCPLHCVWCHNPECISFEPQMLHYPEKCIGCGKCDEGCYAGARVLCGREMTVEDIMSEILADKPYYGEQGGVTISGGEPLAHREFTMALIEACHREGIHVGVESSLYRFDEEILSSLDLIMADLKIFDDDKHKKYVGIGNEAIKQNLRRADALGIPMIIRTPIVPGINDTVENISATAEFLRTLKNVTAYELLPYHPLGISKATALGIEMQEFTVPTSTQMEELKKYAHL
ncbi:MAG: glycyl-radical enzyme activating protein [Clostridia bacterium]|nr:glycyl-radical enzyme activating protein [Clostridia bacterium]